MSTIYAITPRGIGKRPSARAIKDTWALQEGETFTVREPLTQTQVVTDNGLALREMTPEEIASEKADEADKEEVLKEQGKFVKDIIRNPLFLALRRANPSAIDNFVSTHFNTFPQTFTPQQQEVIRLLLSTAILVLRQMR